MVAVAANNVVKSYARVGQTPTHVLRGASCTVQQGEFVALVGPSGAGKSTLLHVLATLDTADAGSVLLTIDGTPTDVSRLSASRLAGIRNRYIGVVFQFHHLLPEFTAVENVMFPLLIGGTPHRQAHEKAMDMLERVGLQHTATPGPAELSGGEQQRVAIARAVIQEPSILFADEPTGNLDSVHALDVINLLVDLQQQTEMTCVVVTHSQELASRAHRILHMRDGIIQE